MAFDKAGVRRDAKYKWERKFTLEGYNYKNVSIYQIWIITCIIISRPSSVRE